MTENGNLLEKIMELGIGISIARQMPNFISQCMPDNQAAAQPAPPQIPVETEYYLVVGNTQAGPFKESDLLTMIKHNLVKADTLVWKTGMQKWLQASQVPEVNKLFLLSKI